jgi:16S rRNA processing protein RimM
VVGRPHGVRGLVRVTSHTEDPEALAAYSPLLDERGRRWVLEWRSPGIARLAEEGRPPVADRDAAARLTNLRLYVPRERLPAPEAESFYLADLEGLAARDAAGRPLGRVARVLDYGGGASLEIERPGGEALLVPFTRAAVPVVDVAAGFVVVEPPAVVTLPGGGEA